MSPSSRLSLPRSVLQQGRDRSFVIAAQRIQIVTPPLVHPYPLIPIGRPVIDAADLIVVGVRERPFDRIGVPLAALVEKRRRRRAKPVRRQIPRPIAHTIGRAHVSTPVTNAHTVYRLFLEKTKDNITHR